VVVALLGHPANLARGGPSVCHGHVGLPGRCSPARCNLAHCARSRCLRRRRCRCRCHLGQGDHATTTGIASARAASSSRDHTARCKCPSRASRHARFGSCCGAQHGAPLVPSFSQPSCYTFGRCKSDTAVLACTGFGTVHRSSMAVFLLILRRTFLRCWFRCGSSSHLRALTRPLSRLSLALEAVSAEATVHCAAESGEKQPKPRKRRAELELLPIVSSDVMAEPGRQTRRTRARSPSAQAGPKSLHRGSPHGRRIGPTHASIAHLLPSSSFSTTTCSPTGIAITFPPGLARLLPPRGPFHPHGSRESFAALPSRCFPACALVLICTVPAARCRPRPQRAPRTPPGHAMRWSRARSALRRR